MSILLLFHSALAIAADDPEINHLKLGLPLPQFRRIDPGADCSVLRNEIVVCKTGRTKFAGADVVMLVYFQGPGFHGKIVGIRVANIDIDQFGQVSARLRQSYGEPTSDEHVRAINQAGRPVDIEVLSWSQANWVLSAANQSTAGPFGNVLLLKKNTELEDGR
ncbi:hypothetical protein ACFWZ4_12260 [Frateuria sp. GZRe12]|uniref:hypothetical protein n=1 Tax=Frateuria sp. GZRe12 TaxID=3351533 RepID=UPI003EDC3CF1